MDGNEVEPQQRLYEAIRLDGRVIAIRPGPLLGPTLNVQECPALDRTWQPPAYWNPDVVSSARAAAVADYNDSVLQGVGL